MFRLTFIVPIHDFIKIVDTAAGKAIQYGKHTFEAIPVRDGKHVVGWRARAYYKMNPKLMLQACSEMGKHGIEYKVATLMDKKN